MKKALNKNVRAWLPPVIVLAAYIIAELLNMGASVDTAGINAPLNVTASVVFLAAWVVFFILYRSEKKILYVVSAVYWLFAGAYLVVNAVSYRLPVRFPNTPFFTIASIGLLPPVMGFSTLRYELSVPLMFLTMFFALAFLAASIVGLIKSIARKKS